MAVGGEGASSGDGGKAGTIDKNGQKSLQNNPLSCDEIRRTEKVFPEQILFPCSDSGFDNFASKSFVRAYK